MKLSRQRQGPSTVSGAGYHLQIARLGLQRAPFRSKTNQPPEPREPGRTLVPPAPSPLGSGVVSMLKFPVSLTYAAGRISGIGE